MNMVALQVQLLLSWCTIIKNNEGLFSPLDSITIQNTQETFACKLETKYAYFVNLSVVTFVLPVVWSLTISQISSNLVNNIHFYLVKNTGKIFNVWMETVVVWVSVLVLSPEVISCREQIPETPDNRLYLFLMFITLTVRQLVLSVVNTHTHSCSPSSV